MVRADVELQLSNVRDDVLSISAMNTTASDHRCVQRCNHTAYDALDSHNDVARYENWIDAKLRLAAVASTAVDWDNKRIGGGYEYARSNSNVTCASVVGVLTKYDIRDRYEIVKPHLPWPGHLHLLLR